MKNFSLVALVVVIAVLGVGILLLPMPQTSTAAPLPAPTPISVGATGNVPQLVTFFDARSVTADATSPCSYVGAYDKADVYYSITIDSGNINTTTLALKFGNSTDALVSGVNAGATIAASATSLNQFDVFGQYMCLTIDTTDAATGTVTVSANALLK